MKITSSTNQQTEHIVPNQSPKRENASANFEQQPEQYGPIQPTSVFDGINANPLNARDKHTSQNSVNNGPSRDEIIENIMNMEERDVVPPIFQLGEAATKQEILIDGFRVLTWDLTGSEEGMANIASWGSFGANLDEEAGLGMIFIPEGTRNAKSVLSGKEAWAGEKGEVINAVARYINKVEEDFKGFDVNLSWGSVGRTPDGQVFISPPNSVVDMVPNDIISRKQEMASLLDRLLQQDKSHDQYINSFKSAIGVTGYGNK